MYSIAICDDNEESRRSVVDYLSSRSDSAKYAITQFDTAEKLRAAVGRGYVPDIAVMDIKLENENGIEVVKELFGHDRCTQVIYLTGFAEYCSDVYETEHIYFLLKPIEARKFLHAMDKAVSAFENDAGSFFALQMRGKHMRISTNRILYIESDRRKIRVFTDDGEYVTYDSLPEAKKILPDSFIFSHKSFLVNLARTAGLEPSGFKLDDGRIVPISQKKSQAAREAFLRYIGGMI